MPTIPIKDYIYGALLVLSLATFGLFTLHERHEGRAAIVAADKRTAMVAEAKDKSIVAAGQAALTTVGTVYEKAVAIPAVADIGVVCVAPRRSGVSGSADYRPDITHKADVGSERPFDPTGGVLTLLRDDDAKINGLIDTVGVLTDTMNKLHAMKP